MGFGITSLKKQNEDEVLLKKIFVEHLIIGEDFATALAFTKLCAKYGSEKVVWIKSFRENSLDFEKKWKHFSFLSVEHDEINKPQEMCFYKDQQFKLFTGRSQPQSMSYVEKKLLGDQKIHEWESVLQELELEQDWKSFDQWVESSCIEAQVFSFYKSNNQDLVEKDKFCIQSSGNDLYIVDKLYWGQSCQNLRSIMDRDLLEEKIIDTIELRAASEIEVSAFIVNLDHQTEIHYPELLKEFVFIPVSQSQEQGHFIGMLNKSNASFFHHFDEEIELTKEEVARRIKKLKRNLERIFKSKDFQKSIESIYFSQELFCISKEENEDIIINSVDCLHFLPIQSFSNNLLLDKINHLKNL